MTCTTAATTLDIAEVVRRKFEKSPTCWCTATVQRRRTPATRLSSNPCVVCRRGQGGAGVTAPRQPPDGRDAHRRFDPGPRAAREGRPQPAGARDIADRLMASLGSMLLYWYHFSNSGRRIEVETDDDSSAGHFLHLLHGAPLREAGCAPYTRSTCTPSTVQRLHLHRPRHRRHRQRHVFEHLGRHWRARPQARRRQRVAFEIQKRYDNRTKPRPTSAAAWRPRKWIIGFGHPVCHRGRPAQRHHQGRGKRLSGWAGSTKMYDIAGASNPVMGISRRCSPTSTGSAP